MAQEHFDSFAVQLREVWLGFDGPNRLNHLRLPHMW